MGEAWTIERSHEQRLSQATNSSSSAVNSPIRLSNLQNGADAVIELQNEEPGLLEVNFKHIQTYMVFINFTSVRDYLKWLPGWTSLKTLRLVGRLQKAIWFSIILLSSLNAFVFLKELILQLNEKQSIKSTYIVLGLLSSQLAFKWIFLITLIIKSKKLRKFFDTLEYKIVETSGNAIYSKIATLLFVVSFLLSTSICLSGLGMIKISNWSFHAIVEIHYSEIKAGFTEWNSEPESQVNASFSLPTTDIDTQNQTQYRTLFATIGFLSEFSNLLVEFCVGDIFVLVTYLLSTEVDEMNNLIIHYDQNKNRSYSNVLCHNVYNFYKCIQQCSLQLNTVFGHTFKLFHAYNLFLTVYFLHEIVTAGDLGTTVLFVIKLSRAIFGYCFAILVSNKMEPFMTFIQDCKNQELLGIDSLSYAVIKDDAKQHPIGIGRDSFYVNEKFIRQFMVMAVTFFFILIDDTKLTRTY